MSSTLIVARRIYAPGIPDAQALLINDGVIAWIGDLATAQQFKQDAQFFLDAGESFVAPGFVDAHVHLSATGLNLLGFNASSATSFRDLANLVNEAALSQSGEHIYLQGWDETSWTDTLSDFNEVLSTQALSRTFYLSRIDGHSAIVNGSWFDWKSAEIVSGSKRESIWNDLTQSASDELVSECVKAALQHAASNGVVAVHENGGPTVSSEQDFAIVQTFANQLDMPAIYAYWADLDTGNVVRLAAAGAAGDLSVDGSIGSRSAKLFESYADASDNSGLAYLEIDQIAKHIVTTTNLGLQAGFHAIGDEACARVHAGFVQALDRVTVSAIRSSRHRIEHLSMPSVDSMDLYADLGVVASVQPAFDATWGGPAGMYESRLGIDRLANTHPFADMVKSGMVLAFGSDSPVTEIKPWNWVKAANNHHQMDQRITLRASFNAATRGGHRAARNDESGVLAIGAPADIAIWQVNAFADTSATEIASSWSTDSRSGTHALPDLSQDSPVCLATLRNGQSIYDPEGLFSV